MTSQVKTGRNLTAKTPSVMLGSKANRTEVLRDIMDKARMLSEKEQAARDAADLLAAEIQPAPPRPPWYKRKMVWVGIGAGFVVLIVLIFLISFLSKSGSGSSKPCECECVIKDQSSQDSGCSSDQECKARLCDPSQPDCCAVCRRAYGCVKGTMQGGVCKAPTM